MRQRSATGERDYFPALPFLYSTVSGKHFAPGNDLIVTRKSKCIVSVRRPDMYPVRGLFKTCPDRAS